MTTRSKWTSVQAVGGIIPCVEKSGSARVRQSVANGIDAPTRPMRVQASRCSEAGAVHRPMVRSGACCRWLRSFARGRCSARQPPQRPHRRQSYRRSDFSVRHLGKVGPMRRLRQQEPTSSPSHRAGPSSVDFTVSKTGPRRKPAAALSPAVPQPSSASRHRPTPNHPADKSAPTPPIADHPAEQSVLPPTP